jgi:DsbC/DsbD-like thiol-disulfide interchange protein
MIAPGLRRRAVPVFVLAALLAQMVDIARRCAAESSAWVGDARSALRLVAGTPDRGQGYLRAGVEIDLAPGWKTYWRYPGDSGIPPRFDFTGSTNVRSVDIEWPAPQAWRDPGGVSIGYKDKVILPLRVVAQNPGQPVGLVLAFDYAICENVCIPKSGNAELQISSAAPSEDAALAAAAARVPRKSALGADKGLAIRAVERVGDWPQPRLLVDVAAPAGATVELFAEGPTPDWALPVPEPVGTGRDGIHRFAFVLDGVPPGVDPKGATLTLTAVAGKEAIETPYRLD